MKTEIIPQIDSTGFEELELWDGGYIYYKIDKEWPDSIEVASADDFCIGDWCQNGSMCFGAMLGDAFVTIKGYERDIDHVLYRSDSDFNDLLQHSFYLLDREGGKVAEKLLKVILTNLKSLIEDRFSEEDQEWMLDDVPSSLERIPNMNDNLGLTKEELAWLWNKTWSDLDYAIPRSALKISRPERLKPCAGIKMC